MTFQTPWAFLLLLCIPLYLALRKAGLLQKPSYKAVLEDWNGTTFQWKDPLTKFFYLLSRFLIYIGFISAVLALTDPVKKHQEKIFTNRGTDILFVLDTSPSMTAKDMNGKNRLQVAKDTIELLVKENNGTRYGLVTLGTEAAVSVPPTSDTTTFISRLQSINAGYMGDGSAIGTGLSTAVYHLISSAAPKRCIVLFTDGENNAGDIHPETAASLAANHNITLYVFGIGSKGTVSIDYTDPVTGKKYQGYLDSDFDSSALRKIALSGNGKYFEAATQDQLISAMDLISRTETLSQDFIYKTIMDSYFKLFLTITGICMILSWLLSRLVLKIKWFNPVKSILWSASFILILIALSNLSWGISMIPVYKSSNAVAMVFDISNSMTVKDEENKLSRLEASAIFAKKLISKMEDTPVSVILAKGEGITAVPLTEDFFIVESLIDSLSPNLMSTPGTSLAKGIDAAANGFPENISAAKHIWLFTDGEETENHLKASLSECIKKGISVKIIGFGSESGIDLKLKDVSVHTSLQSETIQKIIEDTCKKVPDKTSFCKPVFLKASSKGTGTQLISSLEKNPGTGNYITWEEKPVSRYKLFLIPAFILFILGITISEIRLPKTKRMVTLIIFTNLFILSGCQKSLKTTCMDNTFKGAMNYKRNEMTLASGEFLYCYELASDKNNQFYMDYSLFNLSTSYLLGNEDEAALFRLSQISDQADKQIQFAACYNTGIILYKQGKKSEAAEYFKKALLINSTSIDAKINLELSLNHSELPVQENEGNLIHASESNDFRLNEMEETIFERIKENDKKQWKNSESAQNTDYSKDY